MDTLYIKNKFVEADPYLNELRTLTKLNADEYLENFQRTLAGERLFEIISQIILDICTHIVARLEVEKPSNYSDCITTLSKQGILEIEFGKRIAELIKMRNIIVYRYGKIDQSLVFSSLKTIQADFEKYKSSVLSWMKNQG